MLEKYAWWLSEHLGDAVIMVAMCVLVAVGYLAVKW